MRVVVNTPEEKIGRTVVSGLLDNRSMVTVIGRKHSRSRRMSLFISQGASFIDGAMDDVGVLRRAMAGSDTLFWQTPLASRPDLHQWAVRTAEIAAGVAVDCGIQRVVNVSSAGAPSGKGTGLVSALLRIENTFRQACKNTVNLRPGVIMEQTLGRFDAIRRRSALELPLNAHKPLPMVSAGDIGNVAVDYLLNTAWFGHLTVNVTGPKSVTPAEAAAILATEMGTEVSFRRTTMAETRRGLRSSGVTNYEAEAILEMYEAIGAGNFIKHESQVSSTRTTTHLADVVKAGVKEATAKQTD